LLRNLKPAAVCLLLMTILTGGIYPLAVTGLAQAFFPSEANGSIIVIDGKAVGSALIGQEFTGDRYFWGRLPSTPEKPYNTLPSAGSNLGPLNPELVSRAKRRVDSLRRGDPDLTAIIPADLATSSGSGLDPDISPEAAMLQVPRVARARNLPVDTVRRIVDEHVQGRQLGVLGQPRVNVLALNLYLDRVK
jgi:K+-transporting ATPase ATPase C chain